VSSGLLTRVDHDTALRAGVAAIMRVKAREQQVVPQTRPELFEHQRPKRDDWAVWLLIGGRGSGKTEAGARFVDEHARGEPCLSGPVPHRIGIIAPSHDDAVDTCVRGESGLLQQNRAIRFAPGAALAADLTWPNGAEAELFGAFAPEDVERLRGPQHCLIWGDEFAAWRKMQAAYDMAAFGLRLGEHPRWILTTTPKRRPLLKELVARQDTEVTKAKTSDNPELPEKRRDELYARYGGTLLGRQELDAELIEDVPGALWNRDLIIHRPAQQRIDTSTKALIPDMARIVVGVDPNVSEGNDAAGIVVDGLGNDGKGYTLADYSTDGGPNVWAARAVKAYHEMGADRIVAEANNGGDLVATVIRIHDPKVPVELVHAARGKRTRAEPVSALYEQGKWVHVEPFPELEDEMCSYTGAPGEDSPDRMDAHVWAASELFKITVEGGVWGSGGAWGQ
jgi:phage terminase large subunit-like protein